MSFKLVKADEPLQARPLVTTLFGAPGIGKTSLSFTMPNPVLFMDFDKGIERASQRMRPDYFSVTGFEPFFNFVMSADFEKMIQDGGYKSVAVDTVGTMLDDYGADYVKRQDRKNQNSSGGLTLPGYGALKDLFNTVRTRLQSLGLHICFVCHDKDLGDDSPVKMGLSVTGSSSDIIQRCSDLIGYVYPRGDKRYIDFRSTQLHIGKDTGKLGELEVPEDTTDSYASFMAGVIKKCHDRMTDMSTAQIDATKVIETYRDGIDQCNNAAQFTEMLKHINAEDSDMVKAQLRHLLSDRLKQTDVTIDKETKQFVDPQTAY